MQNARVSKLGTIRHLFGNASIAATLLILSMTLIALGGLWMGSIHPEHPAAPATAAVLQHDTRQDQDAMLDRLVTAPYLAEIARLAPLSCVGDCYVSLQQQMQDLAEQGRRSW